MWGGVQGARHVRSACRQPTAPPLPPSCCLCSVLFNFLGEAWAGLGGGQAGWGPGCRGRSMQQAAPVIHASNHPCIQSSIQSCIQTLNLPRVHSSHHRPQAATFSTPCRPRTKKSSRKCCSSGWEASAWACPSTCCGARPGRGGGGGAWPRSQGFRFGAPLAVPCCLLLWAQSPRQRRADA